MPEYIIDSYTIAFTRQAMNAAHQAYPREFAEWNLALFQKGKPVLPGVTVREIAPVGMTDGDKAGLAGRGEMAPVPEAAGATASAAEEQRATKPAPPPVDAGGEWLMLYNTLIQYSNRSPVRWHNSEPNSGIDCWSWDFNINQGAKPIARAAALAWLRANGHAKVADELEGDRFEPVEVQPRKGDVMQSVRDGERRTALADGVEERTQPDKYQWETRTSDIGSVLTRRDGGGWRIKRRTGGN